ncbi:hypothetical protein DYY67_0662 [Candidatus Nitrosotalea sp. TS]|nr:hypothetical protein [Candidatus Nitrosotalea sp. TS]
MCSSGKLNRVTNSFKRFETLIQSTIAMLPSMTVWKQVKKYISLNPSQFNDA